MPTAEPDSREGQAIGAVCAPGYLPASLAACHECDQLNEVPELPPKGVARCCRCGYVLYRNPVDCIEKSLALTLGSALLFVVANVFPFMAFGTGANIVETTLTSGAVSLWNDGMQILAVLVLITSVIAPGLQIAGLLYVLIPLRLGFTPRDAEPIYRMVIGLGPWSMMEVFLLGILVSIVKLVSMAEIIPGVALWAFGLLIITLSWANSTLEPRVIWERVEVLREAQRT
jgi:paraquat-inducible protein A